MLASETVAPPDVEAFIARWRDSGGAERANYALFLTELCDVLGVPHPDPSTPDNAQNAYVIDRSITRRKADGTHATVYADCYKRGCFILETKQGTVEAASSRLSNTSSKRLEGASTVTRRGHGVRHSPTWDIALERAYHQAAGYIRDLPAGEGRPPFLIVCDVGYVIELYSEFTCTGGSYVAFPDPRSRRIYLEDLRDAAIRERLRLVWTDPQALDPSRHAAKVTREVAEHFARLAKSLEADGHDAFTIATFLQRCLFTMFAEDVELLPKGCFTELLVKLKANPGGFAPQLQTLWRDMNDETEWSVALMQNIAYFNGGLFENATALPLKADQIAILIGAAKQNWAEVEPAIFGTLLERALSPEDRHKLGAHYTPRSYVERLVKPTVIDPLRSQWNDVKGAALQLHTSGKPAEAIDQIHAFHRELCQIRVLDPACGSGNFLYVVLEHMKRLESEVLELLQTLGDTELTFEMEQFKVRPQQFLGLELNERAVAIAQLVLWIGYFQWHRKTTGTADTKDRPLLPKERTIRHQDAVLAYDTPVPRTVEAASSRFSEVALNKRQDAAATDERQDAASTCAYLNPFKELQETKSNLPHWRQEGVSYFVTFRQADSIPQTKLKKWAAEKESWSAINPGPHTPEQRREYFDLFSAKLEEWLDAGYGSCALKDSECKRIVEEALRHFDGQRYQLGTFVVAANHVHAIVTPKEGHELSDILHSWKSFTATKLNQHLGKSGPFWQKESYDHILRTPAAAARIETYIHEHNSRSGFYC